ncbi:MAG TPA: nucleotide exchange factor GrpE [Nocardioidaceae bacterium]|nr:nucleotide exchange factor GrpE [Nocardioidaceae bacterium]
MTSAENQHESTAPDTGAAEAEGSQATAAPGPGGPVEGQQPDAAAQSAETIGEASAELVDDLAKAQQDVSALTGDLQRLQAEYLNYKRRVDRDRELVKQNATFAVLTGLLPVLDDIDRAREHGEVEGGFKAVADSLERIVASLGLEKFGQPGDEFDPNLHEALMHAHSPDVTTTTCQNIVHAGYRIGDRVVRPARVTVVDPEPAASQAESRQDGQ